VAVPEGVDEKPVREFSGFTGDLEGMAEWLIACGVTTVAMESTGVYWLAENPGYFRGRYDYVKEWRRRRKANNGFTGKVIQDERPSSKPMQRYVLLIPETRAGVIQDEIVLRRLDGSTFAAYG